MDLILSNGLNAIVDDEDYRRCLAKSRLWHCLDGITVVTKYAYCWHPYPWQLTLHRFILNPPDDMIVDHRNGNGLDNRKENLRVLTYSQHNHLSQLDAKGYHWESSRNKWKAMINVDGKAVYLGRFDFEEDAALAYQSARKHFYPELFGDDKN